MFDQAILAVLADRLQQPVASVGAAVIDDDQRPGHQVREQLVHVVHVDRITRADGLDRLEGATPSEHRQAVQQPLLRLGQQVVRPVDGGLQRLVTFDRVAVAAGEEPEPSV